MSEPTDLLVRIAVLETQLKHEQAAKEVAISNSRQVLKTLTSIIANNSNPAAGEPAAPNTYAAIEIRKLRERLELVEEENTNLKAILRETEERARTSPHDESESPPNNNDVNQESEIDLFELNSDILEIDDSRLEDILHFGDDEANVLGLAEQDATDVANGIHIDIPEGSLVGGLDSNIPRSLEMDLFRNDGSALSTPVPGVLRVGLGVRGVSAGEYKIPSAEEIEQAILADVHRANQRNGPNYSSVRHEDFRAMYWRHGIAYQVDPQDESAFRTVYIGNISPGVSMEQVLEYVRGGAIVSAVLLDTVSTHRSMSALVIFIKADAAAAYVEYVRQRPIYLLGKQFDVSLVQSATYPMSNSLEAAIFIHCQTRVVRVRNYPANGLPISVLKHDLNLWARVDIPSISYIFFDEEGTLQIRCSSVEAAGRIFGLWCSHPAYREMEIEFGSDPCARSLSDLHKMRPLLNDDDYDLRPASYFQRESLITQRIIATDSSELVGSDSGDINLGDSNLGDSNADENELMENNPDEIDLGESSADENGPLACHMHEKSHQITAKHEDDTTSVRNKQEEAGPSRCKFCNVGEATGDEGKIIWQNFKFILQPQNIGKQSGGLTDSIYASVPREEEPVDDKKGKGKCGLRS